MLGLAQAWTERPIARCVLPVPGGEDDVVLGV